MHAYKKKSLDCVSGMPPDLAAKLEFSNSTDLFRLAADHHTQYMTLISSAWEDVTPVVDWFESQGLYDAGINWLYENTPDVFLRALAINRLLDGVDEKFKSLQAACCPKKANKSGPS